MLAAVGVDRVLTMDLHAEQIQGFFDIPVDNIYAAPILLGDVWKHDYENLVVVSPDVGGVVRARALAKRLESDLAIIDKRRPRPNVAEVMNIIGEVEGRTCVIMDDMVDTANTLCEAADALKEQGADARARVLHARGAVGQRGGAHRGLGARRAGGDRHDPAARRRAGVQEDPRALGRGPAGRDDAADHERGLGVTRCSWSRRGTREGRARCRFSAQKAVGEADASRFFNGQCLVASLPITLECIMKIEVSATSAPRQGTGASRRLRHAGRVPGIVYGGAEPPLPIELDHNALFLQARREAFHASIIMLDLDGAEAAGAAARDPDASVEGAGAARRFPARGRRPEDPHEGAAALRERGDLAGGEGRRARSINHVMNEHRHQLPAGRPARSSSRSTSRRSPSTHIDPRERSRVPAGRRRRSCIEARTRWSRPRRCRRRRPIEEEEAAADRRGHAGVAGAGGEAAAGRARSRRGRRSTRRAGSGRQAGARRRRATRSSGTRSTSAASAGASTAALLFHGHQAHRRPRQSRAQVRARPPQRRLLVRRAARGARARELSRASRGSTAQIARLPAARSGSSSRRPT